MNREGCLSSGARAVRERRRRICREKMVCDHCTFAG